MTRPHDTPLAESDDREGKTTETTGKAVPMTADDGPADAQAAGAHEGAEPSALLRLGPEYAQAPNPPEAEQPSPLLRLGPEHTPASDTLPDTEPDQPPAPEVATDATKSDPDPAPPEASADTPPDDPAQPSGPEAGASDASPDTGSESDPDSPHETAKPEVPPAPSDRKALEKVPSVDLWSLPSEPATDTDPEITPDAGPDTVTMSPKDTAVPAAVTELARAEAEPTSTAPVAPPRPRPACAAALFGKLPTRGDFIARNMPRLLQRPFEDWLIPLVQEARKDLGADWTGHWRGAGPWRFWIGPDVLGGSWQRDLRKAAHEQDMRGGAVTGVLLPSADRHGRDFPLVVVLADALARLVPPPVTASPDRGWYDLCDDLLYAARAGTDIATIEDALDRLPGPLLPEGAEDMAALLGQRAIWAQGTEVLEDGTSRIWRDIAAADHHLAASSRSYWWQAPREGAAQRVLSLAGLPDAGSFAFMLAQGHPDASAPL